MKKILNKLKGNEKGQAMILVLILLVLGGLILAPLLGFMSTGLLAGQMHEERMAELYAADAGVELAIQDVKTTPYDNYNEGDTFPLYDTLNDKTIVVTWTCIAKGDAGATYKIISIATSGSSNTTIDCYVVAIPLFFTNAATSCGLVTWPSEGESQPEVYGPIVEYYDPTWWPFVPTLSARYLSQIDQGDPWLSGTLDVKDYPTFGPLFRDGNLSKPGIDKGIINTGITGATATLTGTVYVTGELDIGLTNQEFILNLDYNTIYCEGNINVGGKTTITGSGCIIAQGNVDFQPKMLSSSDDFVFVMSEEGEVNFQPSGDFYGALAGKVNINLQPGNTLTLTDAPIDKLNFPMESVESTVKIRTWEISLQ